MLSQLYLERKDKSDSMASIFGRYRLTIPHAVPYVPSLERQEVWSEHYIDSIFNQIETSRCISPLSTQVLTAHNLSTPGFASSCSISAMLLDRFPYAISYVLVTCLPFPYLSDPTLWPATALTHSQIWAVYRLSKGGLLLTTCCFINS